MALCLVSNWGLCFLLQTAYSTKNQAHWEAHGRASLLLDTRSLVICGEVMFWSWLKWGTQADAVGQGREGASPLFLQSSCLEREHHLFLQSLLSGEGASPSPSELPPKGAVEKTLCSSSEFPFLMRAQSICSQCIAPPSLRKESQMLNAYPSHSLFHALMKSGLCLGE